MKKISILVVLLFGFFSSLSFASTMSAKPQSGDFCGATDAAMIAGCYGQMPGNKNCSNIGWVVYHACTASGGLTGACTVGGVVVPGCVATMDQFIKNNPPLKVPCSKEEGFSPAYNNNNCPDA